MFYEVVLSMWLFLEKIEPIKFMDLFCFSYWLIMILLINNSYENFQNNPAAKNFIDQFMAYGSKNHLKLDKVPFNEDLPTSFHSFRKLSSNLPGIVITNYKSNFTNRYNLIYCTFPFFCCTCFYSLILLSLFI